jgi:hypothetical protein
MKKRSGKKDETQTTAAGLYGRRRQRIGQALMDLRNALNAHEARFTAQGKTSWGYPGDLGRVLELLTEALGAVKGPAT